MYYNKKMVLQMKPYYYFYYEKVMGWFTNQCKMLLFCKKTVMKESHNFELAITN